MPVVTLPVLPGAEPLSVDGGPHGALVLHGFTGNPQSMRPLATALAGAGYSVEMPLLPGHGTAVEDMVPTRWSDWWGATDAAYRELAARCDRVVVVGLSMGGTLSCRLAIEHPEVAGLALVNPLVVPPDQAFRDAAAQLLASGVEVAPGIGSDIAKDGVAESAYAGSPIRAALSLFAAAEEVASRVAEIHCPVLLFTSREDHVVAPPSGDLLERSVSGPIERIWLERSYHVATLDWDADEIEARVLAFAAAVLEPASEAR